MKRISFIPALPLAGCLIFGVLAFGTGSAYGGWQLVWGDDFTNADGSSPDPTKWGYDIGNGDNGWGNAQLEYDTSRTNNIRIQGGNLVIEADQENYGGFDYTSGRMNTKGKWSWTYGRIEARIKIPRGQGIWPAFWMLGANIDPVGWPTCGEIDIMENIGKTSDQGTDHGTMHGPGYSGGNGIGGTYTLPGGAKLSDDFHIYAIEWTTNQIKWYLDNNLFFTATPASLPAGTTWVFTAPQFIILNVAVGGYWPGYPDGTTVFPQQMLVDYVHVYSYVTTSVPDVPTGLRATAGGTQVVLSWSPSIGATNYNVKFSTSNGGPYLTIGSTAAASYTNTGLANGTPYYYVVSAVNSFGESSNSIQVSATTTVPSANLALNKPVTVSSVENAGLGGANAVDGNTTTTRWSSGFSDPQWIYVDLQATVNVNRVRIYWENSYATSYQIQVSSNAVDWTPIYSTTTGTGGVQDLTGLSGTGRYVRMYGTVRKTIYGYSLYEFEVYGNITVPTGLSATAGNQQVSLSWNVVPGATSYNVKSSTTNGGPYLTIASPATTGYTNTGLVNGTTYYYVVSQVNPVAESSNSIQVSAMPTTPANHPPVLAAIADQTILAGRMLLVTNSATDADVPQQTLTFNLLTAPTNAAINTNSGVFSWRPTIAQSPSTQTIAVVVSDSGTPSLSATQSFTATVTQPVAPALNGGSASNGGFGFWINGDSGPDYVVLASTNLTSWNPIFTNNSPSLPCFWVDTNSAAYPVRYYRTILGP
ncbi:MAG TPA: family 16 glycosylhydrolase [Verrucomicrobiae bacterium]|nr:family 16 glycosylhydrolase [Verrucomicrobiae bacterium]